LVHWRDACMEASSPKHSDYHKTLVNKVTLLLELHQDCLAGRTILWPNSRPIAYSGKLEQDRGVARRLLERYDIQLVARWMTYISLYWYSPTDQTYPPSILTFEKNLTSIVEDCGRQNYDGGGQLGVRSP
jgi:hypothetical protein